jgi:hypothetical protein
MNSIAPTAPAEPLVLRLLRLVARLVLAIVITFILGLAILAVSVQAQEVITALLGWGSSEVARSSWMVMPAIAAVLVVGSLSWLGRRLSWRTLGIGYAVVSLIFAYLVWDKATLHRPQTLEEFSPPFPGAEESYTVLMRYGKNHPAGRNFTGSRMGWIIFDPQKPELWQKFMTEHRAEIEKEWQTLAPVWAWWKELNGFARLGDLTPAQPDAEIPAFSPYRMLSQRACAIATLQALDGRGDEAIETLLPLIEVARKLQPSSRTLVRTMIAVVIEKMAMQTAGFVLDHAAVSPATRARLAAALSVAGGGEPGARRLAAVEYVFAANGYIDRPLGDLIGTSDLVAKALALPRVLNFLGPFIYNRRATLNLYADLTTDEEELAGRRQLEQLASRQKKFLEEDARPRFKNFMGAMLLKQMVPATNKVVGAYWKTQDERAALLARVTTS